MNLAPALALALLAAASPALLADGWRLCEDDCRRLELEHVRDAAGRPASLLVKCEGKPSLTLVGCALISARKEGTIVTIRCADGAVHRLDLGR